MLKGILIVGLIVILGFASLTFYACCVAASRADRMFEAAFNKNKQLKGEEGGEKEKFS